MRRTRIILLAAILSLFGLGGCGKKQEAVSATTEMTVVTETSEVVSTQDTEAKDTETDDTEAVTESIPEETTEAAQTEYHFKNRGKLSDHYEKHGIEMGFDSAEAYEKAASDVVNNPSALHKKEAEDGDDVYYVEATNEFVVVSPQGYLRTYFLPNRGIDYYNSQ